MLNKVLIVLYNILILLLPASLSFKGISYSKILFIYSILVTIYLIIRKKINKDLLQNKTFKYLSISFFSFFIIVFLSTLINTILDKKIIFSNFFESLRVIEYYLFILNYYVLLNEKENKKVFSISLIILLLINVILAFFQYYNFFNLNELYIKLIAPTQYESLINGYQWPRAVGLAANPNVFGFLISLSSCYILNLILKNIKKWYYYVLYLILIITLFLTSSRTAYITLIVSGLSLIFFSKFRFSWVNIKKTIIAILIFLVFQLSILFILPNSYTWRIKMIFDIENANSWQNRVENNKDFFEDLNNKNDKSEDSSIPNSDINEIEKEEIEDEKEEEKEEEEKEENKDIAKKEVKKNKLLSYIIGVGPDKLKEKHQGYFDNEWIMIFFHYGILGILVYLFMLIFPLFSIKKNKDFNYPLYITLILMNFVYMIAAASFHSYLLFGFTSILIAYILNEDANFSLKK